MRLRSGFIRALAVAAVAAVGVVAGDAAASGAHVGHGQRLLPSAAGHHAAASATAGGRVTAMASGANGLIRSFDAVGSRDSGVTNFGAEFEPPDQGLCVGNGFVVEMVNSAWQVFDRQGRPLTRPQNVNAPFGDGFKQFTSDPRCYYDPGSNTWIATILFLNDTFTKGRLDIAINHGDPTDRWSQVKIDTTDPGGNGCPCFGDQPRLGIDANNVYVTTDEFSINGPEFNGAQLYAISRHDLFAGDNSHVFHTGLRVDGDLAFGVQPAFTLSPSPVEYMFSSLDPVGAGDNRLAVWAISHTDRVGNGGTPVVTKRIIGSERYSNPPLSREKGGRSLDSGDNRMQQVEYIDGHLWGELGTAFRPPGASKPRSALAWFDVVPVGGAGEGPAGRRARAPSGLRCHEGQRCLLPGAAGGRAGQRCDRLHHRQPSHVPEHRVRAAAGRRRELRAGRDQRARHGAVRAQGRPLGRLRMGDAGAGNQPRLARQRVHPAPVQPDGRRPAQLGHPHRGGEPALTRE